MKKRERRDCETGVHSEEESMNKELRKRLIVWGIVMYGAETWTPRKSREEKLEPLKRGHGEE